MDKRRELEKRTRRFALKIIEFVATLPSNRIGDVIGYQLVKAGTSVGANYHEANRAESRNDFIHKIGIVEKEAAESCYWLSLCHDARLGDNERRQWLSQESGELLAIFTKAGKTAKAGRTHPRT
jgi:four helix bundle protein